MDFVFFLIRCSFLKLYLSTHCVVHVKITIVQDDFCLQNSELVCTIVFQLYLWYCYMGKTFFPLFNSVYIHIYYVCLSSKLCLYFSSCSILVLKVNILLFVSEVLQFCLCTKVILKKSVIAKQQMVFKPFYIKITMLILLYYEISLNKLCHMPEKLLSSVPLPQQF